MMDLMPMINTITQGETVYFVDYSFKKDTKYILDILSSNNCNIIWCDHHSSSINLENIDGFEWLKTIKGIRQDKISGAALTYMYLHNCKFEALPYYIKLVSDYDCWIYKYDLDTTHFKLGIETKDYNALDRAWRVLDIEANDFNCEGDSQLRSIVDLGKTIKTYIDADNTQYRNQWSYESIIGGYRAIVINRKSNSWIFGEKYYEYPLVCVWAFNGEKFSYSIFSGDASVDCSKIAESYGGGGHRGAAGFSSNTLLFTKYNV